MNQLLVQILLGALMVTATIVFHVGGLVLVAMFLKRIAVKIKFDSEAIQVFIMLSVVTLLVLVIHIAGIWLWAGLYMGLDIFLDFESALYFSTATMTTLGYGDLVLGVDWRLFGSFQAMSGMILFGVTAAFLIVEFRRIVSRIFED